MARNRLYRREDSDYWWADYTDARGKRHRESTDCRNKKQAEIWLANRVMEREKARSGVPVARPISLLDSISEYLVAKEPHWAVGWYKTVDGFVRNQVLPAFGAETFLHQISRVQVEDFRTKQMVRDTRWGKRVAPATVNRLMAALATFGQWASNPERGYALTNPFQKHPPLPEGQKPLPVPTPEELTAYLQALPELSRPLKTRYRIRDIVTFAVDTGLRKSEIGRIRWEDVDLRSRTLRTVSYRTVGMTKSKRPRPVALPMRAVEILKRTPKRPDGFVFGPVGDFRTSLRKAGEKAGLGHVWFHLSRHFGATRVSQHDASMPDLMAWGGWSSARMVQRYAHSDHRRMLTLVDRMEASEKGHDSGTGKEATK